MRRNNLIIFGVGTLLLLASFGVGRLTSQGKVSGANTNPTSEEYPLLAGRLFIENPSDTRINFSPLRTALKKYFADNKLTGSLYYEYLPTGTSIRVNGDQQFRGASLIKLPVAMELFKAQELQRVNIDQKVQLKEEWLNGNYGTLYEKGAGYQLSLREATKIMLTESDNTALRAVADTTEKALTNDERALGSLDVDFSQSPDEGINISARSYSSFLKCLYFACYNNKQDSQEILQYLTETKFNNRLVAGIDDKNVKVAHKIGVYNTRVQGDCGIVYVEKNNYVLCIILNGNDDDTTNGHMAELSKMVYSYIANP